MAPGLLQRQQCKLFNSFETAAASRPLKLGTQCTDVHRTFATPKGGYRPILQTVNSKTCSANVLRAVYALFPRRHCEPFKRLQTQSIKTQNHLYPDDTEPISVVQGGFLQLLPGPFSKVSLVQSLFPNLPGRGARPCRQNCIEIAYADVLCHCYALDFHSLEAHLP